MRLRTPGVILIFVLGILAVPVTSDAQQPGKVYRIGFLSGSMFAPTDDAHPKKCPMTGQPNWQAWIEGLRERGYISGQNLVIECRWTEGRLERAPAFAADLVGLKVDLIVATNTPSVRAVKQTTSTIPLVMINVIDPVGRGLVAGLARPGGNVTGMTETAGKEIMGKLLQFLKEVVPKLSRVGVLTSSSGAPPEPRFGEEREAAAKALGLTTQPYSIRAPEELEGAFAAMTKTRTEALLMEPAPFWWLQRHRIIELAAQSRLPAMYPDREFVKAGGLMSYDANRPDTFRRLGFYVDKIFKGANPGDLPVEQPTKFDLVINLKTAKALGLTIPPVVLMQADEVIE